MNIISRIFCFPLLERELNNRIVERDVVIEEQKVRIEDLENRLFVRFGLPAKGVDLSGSKGVVIEPYRTGRQRVRDMVKPPIVTLTPEEEQSIQDTLTQ